MIAMMRKAAKVLALITIMVPMLALTYVGKVSAFTFSRCELRCNAIAVKCVGRCAKPALECVARLGDNDCPTLQEVIDCYDDNFCPAYMETSCIEDCAETQWYCLSYCSNCNGG